MFSWVNVWKCSCFREILFVFICFQIFFMRILMFFTWLYDISWLFVWVRFYSFEKNLDFILYFIEIIIFFFIIVSFLRDFTCVYIISSKILYVTCKFKEILENYLWFLIYMCEYVKCFVWHSFVFLLLYVKNFIFLIVFNAYNYVFRQFIPECKHCICMMFNFSWWFVYIL